MIETSFALPGQCRAVFGVDRLYRVLTPLDRPRASRTAGIAENGAVAERAGAEFHAALEPADRLALRKRLGGGIQHDLPVHCG
jgi:hypothetical protein